MMRLFLEEFDEAYREMLDAPDYQVRRETFHRTVCMATGKLTYSTIDNFANRLMEAFPGLTIRVYCIRNDFLEKRSLFQD